MFVDDILLVGRTWDKHPIISKMLLITVEQFTITLADLSFPC